VLGVLAVAVDGRQVPPHELASRKGRTLLKLLLARRGEVVPAEVAAEVLWPGRPPADPDANLAILVSRLWAVLGAAAIDGGRQGWRFVTGPRVEVDLEEAGRLAGEAGARLAGQPAPTPTATPSGSSAGPWPAPPRPATRFWRRAPVWQGAGSWSRWATIRAPSPTSSALALAAQHGHDRLAAEALEQLGWTVY
jgi:hypothetical protein